MALTNHYSWKNGNHNNHNYQPPAKKKPPFNHAINNNNNSYHNQNQSMKTFKARFNLPVFSVKNKITAALRKDNTVIFIGETASGKTTQIPQYMYEIKLHGSRTIAITQPRRVAAISVAKRVAEEMRTELGHLVGYSVRFDTKATDRTQVKFMTDGMLLREAISDPSLSKYSIVVLDEAHERSISTDLLFGVVKRAQRLRVGSGDGQQLRVVVMSATMDVDHFASYFNKAPVYYLSGRQFPIKYKYSTTNHEDYVEAALITVFQIHLNEDDGDILVFCTGQEEIESMVNYTIATARQLPAGSKKLFACALHASLPHHLQMRAFEPSKNNVRKVIYATNVAETSLTIPGIKYVVDTGKVKRRTFNAVTGYEMLKVENISKAQAAQRAGRAGRECSGICYRLYTEEHFQTFAEHSTPEILRCNLASVVLELIAIGITNVREFDFMDKPSEENLNQAIQLLERFKAIEPDNDNYKLTPLGNEMIRFPLEPRLARALVASKDLGCSEELLTIIALLYIDTVFHIPHEKRDIAFEAHRKFHSTEGDHIMLLNVWRAWNAAKFNHEWCRENFVNERNLKTAKDVRQQLIRLWESTGAKRQSCGQQTETLRKCLSRGFADQVATLQRDGTYKTGKLEVAIHPSSCLLKLKPEHLLYTELVQTSKVYMRNLSVIDPKWVS